MILGYAAWLLWRVFVFINAKGEIGGDLTLYLGATQRWLAGGQFYPPSEVAGPFLVTNGAILYPPSAILLFLPWLVLPAWTFTAIPLCIVAATVWYHRPAPWTWPAMALCLASTSVLVKLVYNNPFAWMAAFVALGTIRGGWAVAVFLKPSLFPFAFIGAWRRSWWLCLATAAVSALLFLPLWPQFFAVLANSRNPQGFLYSLSDAPLLMVPVLAWLGGDLLHKHVPDRGRAEVLDGARASGDQPPDLEGVTTG